MKLLEHIKKVGNELDMKKKYPDYFNKRVFRTLTILLFILFFISLYTNNWKLSNVYAECNSENICKNPFYLCSNMKLNETNLMNIEVTCMPSINWKTKPICDAGYCDIEYLQPHQVIGNKPNLFNKNFTNIVIVIYIIGFIINHYLYKKRTRTRRRKRL